MAGEKAPVGQKIRRGAVAALTGINIETVRYYERIGLLPAPTRTASGHRVYGQDHVMRLIFIRRSRDLGFTFREVRGLLRLVDGGDYSCAEVKAITLDHVEVIRSRITDLRKMQKALWEMASQCDGGTVPECPIIDALFQEGAIYPIISTI